MEEKIIELRKDLTKLLEKFEKNKVNNEETHIKLDIAPKLLEKIIFENIADDTKDFAIPMELLKNLDLTGISFEDVDIRMVDFTGSKGAVINPQEVYYKNMSGAKLSGVELVGSFEGVNIVNTDFTGSTGAVINPQEVYDKDMNGAKLNGVTIIGSFKDVDYKDADFTGTIFDESKKYKDEINKAKEEINRHLLTLKNNN